MNRMQVVEIFKSIDGEGKRTGEIATFIRLYGCNLKCTYCDTNYACSGNEYTEMEVGDIIKTVDKLGARNITITGGEPLIHASIRNLIHILCNSGFNVNIETNGSVILKPFIEGRSENLFFTMDVKGLKSQPTGKDYRQVINECVNASSLCEKDVLKFVVESEEDLDMMRIFLQDNWVIRDNGVQVYVSPVFGKIEPKDIVAYVLEHNLNVKVQVQLHKVIWDPNERGV